MKYIWLSVSPYAPTGYGTVTKNIVPRLVKAGNEVCIATKHENAGTVIWNGVKVICGMDVGSLNRMIDRGEYDYIFSLLDAHALPSIPNKWISYTPFDAMECPDSIAKYLPNMKLILALTKHGQESFKKRGYKSIYVPHGVDKNIFNINTEARKLAREANGYTDKNFVAGIIAINYTDERKGMIELLQAFATFYRKHNNARLYLGTSTTDPTGAWRIPEILKSLGLSHVVILPDEDKYFNGAVTDDEIANYYRMMDVFVMPTKGEGFGLPLIECQACGTPLITTNASTGPELLRGGSLIELGQYDYEWFNNGWRPRPNPQAILNELEKAYSQWESNQLASIGEQASKLIIDEYDWDVVWDKQWRPLLDAINYLY